MEFTVSIKMPSWIKAGVEALREYKVAIAWVLVLIADAIALVNIYWHSIAHLVKIHYGQYCTSVHAGDNLGKLIQPRNWFLSVNVLLLIILLFKLLGTNRLRLALNRTKWSWLVPIVASSLILLIAFGITKHNCWS